MLIAHHHHLLLLVVSIIMISLIILYLVMSKHPRNAMVALILKLLLTAVNPTAPSPHIEAKTFIQTSLRKV